MHPLYTPHPDLRPAVFDRDIQVWTTLAMRGGDQAEFGILYRTFQRCEVRTWSNADGTAIEALLAWLRVPPAALDRVWAGDIRVLDELEPFQLHLGSIAVVCELWTVRPGVVYRLGRELSKEPGVEFLVGRRGERMRAHRVGGEHGSTVRRASERGGDDVSDQRRPVEPAEHA